MSQQFADPNVERVFSNFPADVRDSLLQLRELIFDVAAKTDGVGRLFETLKWGQPAYLTPETKSGSTIRLGPTKTGGFAVYVHCQTSIISDFRALFPDDFAYEGNRALHFASSDELRTGKLELFIKSALTYHRK